MRPLSPQLIDLDRFNVRRRALIAVLEAIRRDLRDQLLASAAAIRVVDSAPVPLTTYTRGARCQSVVGRHYFGVGASKKARFFGFRFHLTATLGQVVDAWLLAPASIHDLRVVAALVADAQDLVLSGDKASNDAEFAARLWRKRQILLVPFRRTNQTEQWPAAIRRPLSQVRHGVETVFSILTTVFNIQRPRGRSLAGYVVRVATCILAYTLSFFLAGESLSSSTANS